GGEEKGGEQQGAKHGRGSWRVFHHASTFLEILQFLKDAFGPAAQVLVDGISADDMPVTLLLEASRVSRKDLGGLLASG
ncbi:MAG: hypothetical protein KC912_18585, partial [Proteobacteria bacterium]|nr:hypothetical protein [Pseudomonadota bacterium]